MLSAASFALVKFTISVSVPSAFRARHIVGHLVSAVYPTVLARGLLALQPVDVFCQCKDFGSGEGFGIVIRIEFQALGSELSAPDGHISRAMRLNFVSSIDSLVHSHKGKYTAIPVGKCRKVRNIFGQITHARFWRQTSSISTMANGTM
jgi:hypothetical protein